MSIYDTWEYLELHGMELEPRSGKTLMKATFYRPDYPWKVGQTRWFTDEDTAILTLLRENYIPLGLSVDGDGEFRGKRAFKRRLYH